MSQNSFIFNFKHAIGLMLLVPALVIALGWGVQTWASHLGVDAHSYGTLLNHQLDKLKKAAPDVETVFVGDSSLGNAISVEEWERNGQGKAVNLALMGHFGFSGMYHMSKRALDHYKPKNLVIMQNVLLATYGLNYEIFGDVSVAQSPLDTEHSVAQMMKAWFSAYMNIKIIRTNVKRIYRFYMKKPDKKVRHIVNDYTDQVSRYDPVEITGNIEKLSDFTREKILFSRFVYLEKLKTLCDENQVNCIVAHGPIFEPMCQKIGTYMGIINKEYTRHGLVLASKMPVCFPGTDLGDTINHVLPHTKAAYTRQYADMLQPFLRK